MIRVNPNNLSDALAAISRAQQEQQTALLQVSTGLRVNQPSDDPAAAAALVLNQNQSAQADQFLRSISGVTAQLQTADSTVNSVVTALQSAIALGVQGANGTLNSADRSALVQQLQQIQQQVVSLANTSFQGVYLFSGSLTTTPPYVLDTTSASGVTYKGNAQSNPVQVGESYQLPVNLPGSSLFSAPGNDVFQALQDLIAGVSAGSGASASTAVTEVRQAYDFINSGRSFYGNTLNQLTQQGAALNSEKVNLAQEQNGLVGANLAESVSKLTQIQASLQAAYTAAGRISQNTLFDYLK